MYEFIFKDNKVQKEQKTKITLIESQIAQTNGELKSAMTNFNNVTAPELIDVYTYQIKSLQKRYANLISELKQAI